MNDSVNKRVFLQRTILHQRELWRRHVFSIPRTLHHYTANHNRCLVHLLWEHSYNKIQLVFGLRKYCISNEWNEIHNTSDPCNRISIATQQTYFHQFEKISVFGDSFPNWGIFARVSRWSTNMKTNSRIIGSLFKIKCLHTS